MTLLKNVLNIMPTMTMIVEMTMYGRALVMRDAYS